MLSEIPALSLSPALSPGKKSNRMFLYGGIRPKNVRELLNEFVANCLSKANSKLVLIVVVEEGRALFA